MVLRGPGGTEPKPSPGRDVLATRHVAFRTDARSFGEARTELSDRGIEVEFQDHGIAHSIYFRDPDGHELEITTYELQANPTDAIDQIDAIHPGADVGHVHLKVSDLERSITFYHEALGLVVTQRMGSTAAFLSAGGYHHHLGLNTWESQGGSAPRAGTTGLFHAAFRYPTRQALADALRRLMAHGVRLDGAADHGVSEALYLHDPDGNGLELYWDRPEGDWPRDEAGGLAMYSRPLEVEGLERMAGDSDPRPQDSA